jgi:hypothetical protein
MEKHKEGPRRPPLKKDGLKLKNIRYVLAM